MAEYYARFIGDPCGYRIPLNVANYVRSATPDHYWVLARIGTTKKEAYVDIAQAYQCELISDDRI
jgi:hypothetical protein